MSIKPSVKLTKKGVYKCRNLCYTFTIGEDNMVELQNFAEELYSFELKCGDKKSVFKDFVLKDLQPKIIKYTRKQKSPTFLFLKSSEDKNLLAYAIKYQMEDFLVEVLHSFPDVAKFKDKNGRNLVCRASRWGCDDIVFAAWDSEDSTIQDLIFEKDDTRQSAAGYLVDRYRDAKPLKERKTKSQPPIDYSGTSQDSFLQ